MDESWYCVATEPRAERAVSVRAGDLAIATYYPTGKSIVRRRRRKVVEVKTERPAMAGYVFVYGARHFGKFRRDYDAPEAVPHCLGWLSGPDGPEPVAPAVIADMRQREADGEFDQAEREGKHWAPRWLRARARVRIIDGPFKGVVGEVWRLTNGRKVAIWVMMLGGPKLAEVAIDSVARAEKTVACGPKANYG